MTLNLTEIVALMIRLLILTQVNHLSSPNMGGEDRLADLREEE